MSFPEYDRATKRWSQNKYSTHQIANMAAQNRKWIGNDVYLSFSHDSHEIPTAIPIFLISVNTEKLVKILSDVCICRKSKMAAINRK